MNEEQNSKTSLSNDEIENDDISVRIQTSENCVDKMSKEKNESTTTSGVMFQELLCRFQQLNRSEDSRLNRICQGILLSNELIDTIEKASPDDMNGFQNCFELLQKEFSIFESTAKMQDEKLFVREIFFPLLDLLSKPQICSYLNDEPNITILHKESYKCLINLFLMSASNTIKYVPLIKDDGVSRKYTNTLCVIYKRLKYNLEPSTQTEQSIAYDAQTTECSLVFFWELTDRTVVVQWLLDTGFVKTILECLNITNLSSQTARKLIGIVHNISRHDDGADELKKFDGLSIIKNFQMIHTGDVDDETNLVSSMAIALLSTTEEIRSDNKRMNKILNQLLQMTMNAIKEELYRHKGFHVSEPLAVFTKLFVDDHSLEYVLNHAETEPQLTISSTITLFVKLLIEFQNASSDAKQLQQFTCIALLNILWSISFQDRYKSKLQHNEDLLKTIKNFAIENNETVIDQYIPRSMESMTKAANGILFNLNQISNGKKSTATGAHLVSNTSIIKPMVMISYAHDNNRFCDKILKELEKHEDLFEIWVDRNHCSSIEDLWEKIARAIKQSNLVLCLLSQDYFNSKSCRKEASFAVQRRKTIIPVYIDEPGDCDWLDIHIAGLKYVRFKENSSELDRGKVQELLTTIQATIGETSTQLSPRQHTKQHSVPLPSPSTQDAETENSINCDMKKPPDEWTTDDIKSWFDSHKVPEALVNLFDFQSFIEMHEYSEKLRADPKKEFVKYEQRYAKHHAGDELEEYKFNRFTNALLSATNNNSGKVKTSMRSHKKSTTKCVACTIS